MEAQTAGFTARNPQLSISTETRLKLYRSMLECRVLEKRAYDLFMQNLIKGTSHLALGMEATAAGFGMAMRPDDYTFCTYRGHNHTLVRGVGMTEILAGAAAAASPTAGAAATPARN